MEEEKEKKKKEIQFLFFYFSRFVYMNVEIGIVNHV